MIIKAEESRKYGCPFKFHGCIGSDCMGWRWSLDENPEFDVDKLYEEPGKYRVTQFVPSKTHGYCGAAGNAR